MPRNNHGYPTPPPSERGEEESVVLFRRANGPHFYRLINANLGYGNPHHLRELVPDFVPIAVNPFSASFRLTPATAGYFPLSVRQEPSPLLATPRPHGLADGGSPLPVSHDMAIQAAEITLPRHLDNEPPHDTWPAGWDTHHDYFLWACRGTVPGITERMQSVFGFEPPIEESFVADRLGGVNAFKQITFLKTYLPGETQTMQRAIARGVLYEAGLEDPEIRGGFQQLDVIQYDPGHESYHRPIAPRWGYVDWIGKDDAFAAMYIGQHPETLKRHYAYLFPHPISLEFLRVRMAQIPYLDISSARLQAAMATRERLLALYPQYYHN